MRSLSLAALLLACIAAIISRESPVQASPRIRPALMQMPFGKRGFGGGVGVQDCFNIEQSSKELMSLVEAWYRMKVADGLSCLNGLSTYENADA